MSKLTEAAEAAIEREMSYHKAQVKYFKEYKQQKRHVALVEKLESSMFLAEETPEISITQYGSVTLRFSNHEFARDFVMRIMDKLKLDKIERMMETYSDKPKWFYYVGNIEIKDDTYYLSVYPAQPVEGCQPKRIAIPREPQMKWICEREVNGYVENPE